MREIQTLKITSKKTSWDLPSDLKDALRENIGHISTVKSIEIRVYPDRFVTTIKHRPN